MIRTLLTRLLVCPWTGHIWVERQITDGNITYLRVFVCSRCELPYRIARP